MLKKWIGCFAAMLLLFSSAYAGEVSITEVATEIGQNHVRYPQLSGMESAQVQSAINDELVLHSGVTDHLLTLVTLGQNPWKIQVDYEASIVDDSIFSAVISARGKMGNQRDGHAYRAFSYDLETGQRIALDELFTDVDAAVERMEQLAEDTLSDELNGYLEYSQIRPLPVDSFTLDEHGITFWYPYEQFSLLSGYSGAVQFSYEELAGLWKEKYEPEKLTNAVMRTRIEESVRNGCLPQVPAMMGEGMADLANRFRLLRTPDEFPGGRYFVMEHPAFRSVMLISDALHSGYDQSVVEGIQLRRGSLHGLTIGKATRQVWQNVLGNPTQTVTVTQSMAYDYNLPQGQYDVYHYGENELRLHADEQGILCAVQLCRQ